MDFKEKDLNLLFQSYQVKLIIMDYSLAFTKIFLKVNFEVILLKDFIIAIIFGVKFY